MPYDTVTGGGVGVMVGGGGYGRRRGGGICSALCSCYLFMVFIIIAGIICTIAGVVFVMNGIADIRGQKLQTWSDAVRAWDNGGRADFKAFDLSVGNKSSSSSAMTFSTNPVTARDFGEPSWSTDKVSTPSEVLSASYSANVCPNAAANQECKFNIYDKSGNLVTQRTLTPNRQTQNKLESKLCSWYDGDYYHPMASVGMGQCNQKMAGNSLGLSSQTYNYGPSKCVEKAYLDSNGCPNDILLQSTLVSWGWGSITSYVTSKPRFTYQNGKCWDYSDCFCTGCGFRFKTDKSKGNYVTGYGYYYGGRWTSFGNNKRQQCVNMFDAIGYNCPSRSINLVCFRAGGYPKKSCQSYCSEKNGAYTPQSSHPAINAYYRPWGSSGTSPTYGVAQPATCTYLDVTQTTGLDIALASDKTVLTGSKWANGKFTEQTTTLSHSPRPFTALAVTVRSSAGPVMKGATITKGCGPRSSNSATKQCFGLTQAQNLATGAALLAIGILLLICPVASIILICAGVFSCLKFLRRRK